MPQPLPSIVRQATEFANRLRKRARHLRRWPARGIDCYRLYERDIPDIPLVVDRYGDRLHISEFARPHDRTPTEHAAWLDQMTTTAAEAMGIAASHVFVKYRDRQKGAQQYARVDTCEHTFVVEEGGLRFQVNLSDYVDTGLFLDHRITRGMVRDAARDRRVLNLFCYTGSFSVYAAAGGALSTTNVDLSRTYLEWAGENMRLNRFSGPAHHFIQADVRRYLADLPAAERFDLVIVDPPTFSNSKRVDTDWETQRDHPLLFAALMPHLADGAIVFFSTNYRHFRLAEDFLNAERASGQVTVREISHRTVPEDFRNRRIHRCWRMDIARPEDPL